MLERAEAKKESQETQEVVELPEVEMRREWLSGEQQEGHNSRKREPT